MNITEIADKMESMMNIRNRPTEKEVAELLAEAFNLMVNGNSDMSKDIDRILTAIKNRWHKAGLEKMKARAWKILDGES